MYRAQCPVHPPVFCNISKNLKAKGTDKFLHSYSYPGRRIWKSMIEKYLNTLIVGDAKNTDLPTVLHGDRWFIGVFSPSNAKWTKWTSKWFSKASCLCRWGTNQELFNEFANKSIFLFNRLNKTRVFATHFTHTNRKERPCFLSPNNYVSFPLLCLIETWDTIIIWFVFKNNGQIIWWIQRKMFLLHFIEYET